MIIQKLSSLIYDFGLWVSRGLVDDTKTLRKFGKNAAVGASEVLISSSGPAAPYMPTAGVYVVITSASADDDAAGAGAQEVTIIGLDDAFNEISETMATNGGGTTGNSQNKYRRLYRAYVSKVGTVGGANVGLLTIAGTGGGTTFVTIVAAKGQSQTTHYCVPAGWMFHLHDLHITVSSAKYCDIHFFQRRDADVIAAPFSPKRLVQDYDGVVGTVELDFEIPQDYPGKTDLWFTGNSGAGGSSCSIEYAGYLTKIK